MAAAMARADLHAKHNHNRPRKVTDDEADEPPQAHGYRIGRNGTTDIPRGRDSHKIHT